MYTIYQGESLLIPATVVGDKGTITSISVELKASSRGEIPLESAAVVATLTVANYDSAEVTDGYLFSLTDTSSLDPGIYYVNFKYTANGYTAKGVPKKVIVKESVI